MTMKQFSPSCERNKEPILVVLREIFTGPGLILEIGSGSGQHAVHFARGLPHLTWQPTDIAENLPSIAAWRAEAGLPNLREPQALDLFAEDWPVKQAQAVVCINTIHIVSWQGVESLFASAGRVLTPGGILYVYGPYRYAHRPLEPSNQDFDRWLKARDPASGVRLFEDVNRLAGHNGLVLAGDRAMPANNRSIWWQKG
jgi:SAM-dependent methyltransferase